MKRTLAFAAMALTALAMVGCGNKNGSVPTSSGVTDVTTTPSPAYTAPQPATAQPVIYDTMPNASSPSLNNSTSTAMAGGSYTVKKGDTLYSIARSRYGDGKQWQKIVSANPGLRPESLKVGQTITVP